MERQSSGVQSHAPGTRVVHGAWRAARLARAVVIAVRPIIRMALLFFYYSGHTTRSIVKDIFFTF